MNNQTIEADKIIGAVALRQGTEVQADIDFKSNLDRETNQRKQISEYIKDHLKEGTDFGSIKIKGVSSKPCLFKPGAEKFCSLLNLRAEFTVDKDTLEMLTQIKGDTFFYICHLINRDSGKVVSEGRGACGLGEKGGQVNTALKIAEKRAMLDAVLRIGLSDTFTQDLEDMVESHAPDKKQIEIDDLNPEEDKVCFASVEESRKYLFKNSVDGQKSWGGVGFKQMLSAVYGTSEWKRLGRENKLHLEDNMKKKVAEIVKMKADREKK